MPVWGVWLDDAFFFSTGRKSRKGQNLAANPACTITNDDGEEAVIVEGTATELEDAAALERVARAYKKKYKMDPRSMGEPIFMRASENGIWIYREDLSEVGDTMEIVEFVIAICNRNLPAKTICSKLQITSNYNQSVFSAPTDALPSAAAFPTGTPRTSG